MLVQLTGIAKLASEGKTLVEKSRVEYRTLPTRKWLNRCHSQRVPFQWTINPYRGCEYGCKYCYARFTHEYLELHSPAAFETEILAKDWDRAAFQNELRSVKPGSVIGLGTATDPYQPAERKFGRTRAVLEALQGTRDISLFITSKSDLVARDADLLKALSRWNDVRVTFSVASAERDFARLTEPYAPRPDLRLRAAAILSQAGVQVGVIASPVLPLLTDSLQNLRTVAELAKASGAQYFGAGLLFLQPAARKVFFGFLAEHFPQHLARYQTNYQKNPYIRGEYPAKISRLVDDVRSEFGFPGRDLSYRPAAAPPVSQLRLF